MVDRWPSGPLRLLHLPNDPHHNDLASYPTGPRDAFAALLNEGILSRYETLLFLADYRKSRDAEEVKRNILARAAAIQPDIVYWHHVAEFPVDQKFIERLRDVAGNPLLVYHEGDAWGRFKKRVNSQLRIMLTNADLVFCVGLGGLAEIFRKAGAKDLRHLPHVYDARRFGSVWDYTSARTYKVSMIANNWPGRLPGTYMPGGRKRVALARKMTATYGFDFALYGIGWPNLISLREPLPFDQQEHAIRNSWVSVNWDHFDGYAYYFSDRLPISLAAGVPHVTTYHCGYEDMFSECPGLYFAQSPSDVVTKVDYVLSKTKRQLSEEGRAAQEWAKLHLEAEVVFRHSIEICAEKLLAKRKVSQR
jgi:hypothetical protein